MGINSVIKNRSSQPLVCKTKDKQIGNMTLTTKTSITNKKNEDPIKKNICDSFGCTKKSIEKLDIYAGRFGTITIYVCINCLKKFKKLGALS